MSMEIEAKFKVASHEAVRGRLSELDAKRVGQVLETNHIFDDPTHSLLAGGCGLRVRKCESEKVGKAEPKAPFTGTMTFKGPIHPGPLKKREEIEVRVDQPDAAVRILESLGFVGALRFEKRRETWELDNCLVELDELPHLGTFIEIEGPDEERIREVQDRLGLAGTVLVREPYVALLTQYCRRHKLPPRVTF